MTGFRITPRQWRNFVAVLVVAFGLLDVLAFLQWQRALVPGVAGTLGGQLAPYGVGSVKVFSVSPGSPLDRAGVKAGDFIRFPHPADRMRLLEVGERISLEVQSGNTLRHLDVPAGPAPLQFEQRAEWVLGAITAIISLAIGAIVAWRQPAVPSARYFTLAVLGPSWEFMRDSLPGGALHDALVVFNGVWFFATFLFFTMFCLTFPDESRGPQQSRLRRLSVPYIGVALLLGAWSVAVALGLVGSPVPQLSGRLYALGSMTLSMAGLVLAWREAQGVTRTRVAWIGLSLGVVYLAYTWANLFGLIGLARIVIEYGYAQLAVIVLAYVGLGVALLRHRLFDIGFAINRALVYTVVSAVLLISFGLLEWLSHKLIHFEDQARNTLLDAGIAIAVFLTFHNVRDRAEHWIERIFFHAWHAKEADLRKFVKQAAHITTPAALLAAFHAALGRFTANAACHVAVRRADGSFQDAGSDKPIDADHPAAFALRAEPVPMFLEGDLAIEPFELAIPMSHRGELNGFVLLGRKPNGESYRPDEVELLEFAAHQVGLDLHALEVEALRRELQRARAAEDALRRVIASERSAPLAKPAE